MVRLLLIVLFTGADLRISRGGGGGFSKKN